MARTVFRVAPQRVNHMPRWMLFLSPQVPIVCTKWVKKQHSILVDENFR
ncbi:hypothetical protein NT01EI_1434 [Edwardsiella ictaluri 93-146]|uniref:Uncharacterized protein n=1 Tax=Edwardsiella ictaluri (strain 93-146) TaxID=634503 RepID=C5BDS4_EDWI9|nr:hypothetical protein NT01EI_1434 [Edwardsiella ictaluri 93-146]